jgi:hypothetical protein
MMKMSWTHSSKAVALGVLLAVTLGAAGTAAAVTFTEDSVPETAQTGEEITLEITMEELYDGELPNEWELKTDTELEDPSWTVIVKNEANEEVTRQEEATDSITQSIVLDEQHSKVQITVTGTVPEINSFDYENTEKEEIVALNLSQVVEGGTSALEGGEWTVHRYTEESQDARETLDEAQSALEGVDDEDAESRFDEAISFYNNEDWEKAKTAANDAKSMAESGSDSGGPPLPLIIGGVAVLVVLVGGGIYYYQQSQQQTSKLQ